MEGHGAERNGVEGARKNKRKKECDRWTKREADRGKEKARSDLHARESEFHWRREPFDHRSRRRSRSRRSPRSPSKEILLSRGNTRPCLPCVRDFRVFVLFVLIKTRPPCLVFSAFACSFRAPRYASGYFHARRSAPRVIERNVVSPLRNATSSTALRFPCRFHPPSLSWPLVSYCPAIFAKREPPRSSIVSNRRNPRRSVRSFPSLRFSKV